MTSSRQVADSQIAFAKAQVNPERRWEVLERIDLEPTEFDRLVRRLLTSTDSADRWVAASLIAIAAGSGIEKRRRTARKALAAAFEDVSPADAAGLSDLLAAVGHLTAKEFYPYAMSFASHDSPVVREAAAFAMTGIAMEDEAVIGSLLRLARDDDPDVRDWAIFALGEGRADHPTASPEAWELYRASLHDPDLDVRQGGQRALALLGDIDALVAVITEGRAPPAILDAACRAADTRLVVPLRTLVGP